MEYKGKKVKLNENYNNAAITINELPDEEMRKIGFTNYKKDTWYFTKSVLPKYGISFNLSIKKGNPKDWKIEVLDEDFCQPYDYQRMLEYDTKNSIPHIIEEEVEKIMKYLSECGIVFGHVVGEYI